MNKQQTDGASRYTPLRADVAKRAQAQKDRGLPTVCLTRDEGQPWRDEDLKVSSPGERSGVGARRNTKSRDARLAVKTKRGKVVKRIMTVS